MDSKTAKNVLSQFLNLPEEQIDKETLEQAILVTKTDPELANWLIAEQKFDLIFTQSLEVISIPKKLKEAVIRLVELKDIEADETDAFFGELLSSIEPRSSLREEIKSTMESTISTRKKKKHPLILKKLAIAAIIVISLCIGILTSNIHDKSPSIDSLALSQSAAAFIYEDNFQLDLENLSYQNTVSWVSQKSMPTPQAIPALLTKHSTLGCKKMLLNGHPTSLICFRIDKNNVVHLFVIKPNNELKLPSSQALTLAEASRSIRQDSTTKCSVTKWVKNDTLHLLVSKTTPPEGIQELF